MRLFVAVDLPPAIRETIALMRGSIPNVVWTPARNYHLCLRFIGEITNRHTLRDIDDALARLSWKPFDIMVNGAFLQEGMTTDALTLGVARSPELDALQTQIESLLRRASLPPIKRRFQPRITIGHIRSLDRGLAVEWVQSHNLYCSEALTVEHVTLFESMRGYEENVYVLQAEYAWNPLMPLSVEDE